MPTIRNVVLTFPKDDGTQPTLPAGRVVMTKDQSYIWIDDGKEVLRRQLRVWYIDESRYADDDRLRPRHCMLIPDGNWYTEHYEHAVTVIMNDGSLWHLVRSKHGG